MLRAISLALLAGLFASDAAAQEKEPPLTLDQALATADSDHPELQALREEINIARAREQNVRSQDDLNIYINAYARWVDPPPNFQNQDSEDHQASLYIEKELYDFGRQSRLNASSQSVVDSLNTRFLSRLDQRRIAITRAFFDVILADLAVFRENEAMSVAYVRYDRTRDRQRLGQRTELDVLRAQAIYHDVRVKYYTATGSQRTTRATLASLMGDPTNVPDLLDKPDLSWVRRTRPDFDVMAQLAMEQNPQILALQESLNGARLRMQAASRRNWPTISSEFELSEYSRQFGSRDTWRAAIVLNVPVYSGDRVSSQVEMESAALRKLRADLKSRQWAVRQEVLETWTQMENLRIQLEQAEANIEFQELNLDNARTLYDMDVRPNLGDAMTLTSAGRWNRAKAEFELGLAWLTLEALTGQPLSVIQERSTDTGAKND